ncbi:MAG: 30S ribosomal protein S5 [Patescibacteria group bacterium]
MQKQSEFKEKVLDLRRVTRVVAGGKRLRFRATVIIGNEKGSIGIGIGKGLDVAQAVAKAKASAMKNIIAVKLKGKTIPYDVDAKFSAAKVIIKPARSGHGLKAGGAVRTILLLTGIRDATAKCLSGTKNKLTNAAATIEALKKIKN